MFSRVTPRTGIAAAAAAALSLIFVLLPEPAAGQYFGRNKVQYDHFDFQVMRSEHFDLHYYNGEAAAARDATRMAERWYTRLADVTGHEILSRQPVVLYANHADFEQTNVVSGELGESTGGVTEGMQRRVVLPLTGVYGESDHVLGHELVHAFQYDMAARRGGLAAMDGLPLWVVEGMAEYLSVGRNDVQTAMWLRDAVLRNDIPDLKKLARDYRYFPYRFGQAAWAWIGGRYGDRQVAELFRTSLRGGWERAIPQVLGVSQDTLSAQWIAALKATYSPLLAGRTFPDSIGRGLAAAKPGPSELMLAPAVSPDGRWIAFIWARDLSLDLYLANARTGEIVKQLASGAADGRFDALSYMGSAGTWSPDGTKFAFVVFKKGDNELAVLDVASAKLLRRYSTPGVGAVASPAWSPDGRTIAFSGSSGGTSDLYLLDVDTGGIRRLTQDAYADLQPAWSPDGRSLAFATDRGPQFSLDSLRYSTPRLAFYRLDGGAIEPLPLALGGEHTNPQFSPDGRSLFFLADADGFRDLYRTDLATGELRRVTRLATGITGLSALSPAMTVGAISGDVAFTVFDRRGYAVRWLSAPEAAGVVVRPETIVATAAGVLPPAAFGRVDAYLADAPTGLPDTTSLHSRGYRATPHLAALGTPSFGLGVDQFGAGLYADLSAYFTDVLGNHGLYVQGLANGSVKDLGGTVYFENMARRLNWGAGLSRTPYLLQYQAAYDTVVTSGGQQQNAVALLNYRQRVHLDEGFLAGRYPLSTTRRLEASAGIMRVGYDFSIQRVLQTGNGSTTRQTVQLAAPPGFTLWQAGLAYVNDHAVFGITSPVEGGRYRFEIQPSIGTWQFYTVTADWRNYFYHRPLTLAVRALHYARYGADSDHTELGTLFIGNGTLVRGYTYGSFSNAECTASSSGLTGCAQIDRMLGSRMAVANAELRLPLVGNERYGVLNFRFLPTELALFADGGVAWTATERPTLNASDPTARTPMTSVGLAARFNLFGAFVLETWYAHPFQRTTGNRFGLQITPGW